MSALEALSQPSKGEPPLDNFELAWGKVKVARARQCDLLSAQLACHSSTLGYDLAHHCRRLQSLRHDEKLGVTGRIRRHWRVVPARNPQEMMILAYLAAGRTDQAQSLFNNLPAAGPMGKAVISEQINARSGIFEQNA